MTDDFTFSLGDFVFERMEVPEFLPWGAEQAATSHRLVGGKKVVDAMGGFDLPIDWSGRFSGPGALDKARRLVRMTKAGKALTLSCGELKFEVLILNFRPQREGSQEITYTIQVEVLKDLATPAGPIPELGVDAAVDRDLLSAQEMADQIGDATIQDFLATAAGLASKVKTFTLSTPGAIAAVIAPIAGAQAQVSVLLAAADAVVLGGGAPLGSIAINIAAPVLAGRLLEQLSSMDAMPDLYDLDAVAERMQINLESIGLSGHSVLAGGEDLFELATQAYGNLEGWATIARANGIVDPNVPGLTQLRIPPTMDDNGGVLA